MTKTEEVQVNEAKVVKGTKKSVSYSLKAMKTHFETIRNDNLTTQEERSKFIELMKLWTEKFIRREYEL